MMFSRTILAAVLSACCATTASAALLSFTTASGQDIPDAQPDTGLLSSRVITGIDLMGIANPSVAGVTVRFTIIGGWAGDFMIRLSHVTPDAQVTSVVLLNRIGTDGSHPFGFVNSGFNNVTIGTGFSDINTAGSYSSSTPISGNYSPQNGATFSDFLGATAEGTWSLYLTDSSGGDIGRLDNWTLDLQAVPEPTTYALLIFAGLAALRWVASRIGVRR